MRNLFLVIFFNLLCFGLSAQLQTVNFDEPVSLMGYASGISMEWVASNEQDVDYYAVRRYANGEYNVVAILEPRGTKKDSVQKYRYIDQTEFVHDLSFQLRVVYQNGDYEESEELMAQHAHSTRTRVISALDNESLARLRLQLDSESDQLVIVKIKTLEGQTLETYNKDLAKGVNSIEIDYHGWPKGYYAIELSDSTKANMQWLVEVDPAIPMAKTRRVPTP